MCLVYERYFDFVLSTVINYINSVSPEPNLLEPSVPRPNEIEALLKTIHHLASSLNEAIAVREGATVHERLTSDLLKLRTAITDQRMA